MSTPDTTGMDAIEERLAALVADAREAGLQAPLRLALLRMARDCNEAADSAGDAVMPEGLHIHQLGREVLEGLEHGRRHGEVQQLFGAD